MGFGSEAFFEKLKKEMLDSNSDGSIYYLLDQEVRKVVYPTLRNKVVGEFIEDVYQEIFFSVWRNITAYVVNMEGKSEGQRVAWLLTITKRRIADFYEKYEKERQNKIYLEDIPTDIEDVSDSKSLTVNEFTPQMEEALVRLFSISTSPEKIISFVYSKIILSSETSSGKPSITSDYLQGRKLYDIFEMMKVDLENYLEVHIPSSVYFPLVEKLEKVKDGELVGDKRFQLTVKTIVDGTNRIQKKMEPQKCR